MRLNLLKQGPSARAKGLLESLKTSGTSRWIGDIGKFRLMDQNELRIARNAPRELVGQAQRKSEGHGSDRIRAAGSSGKGAHRHAHYIHPGIVARHHSER